VAIEMSLEMTTVIAMIMWEMLMENQDIGRPKWGDPNTAI